MAEGSEEYISGAMLIYDYRQVLEYTGVYFLQHTSLNTIQSFRQFEEGSIKYLNLEALLGGSPPSNLFIFAHG